MKSNMIAIVFYVLPALLLFFVYCGVLQVFINYKNRYSRIVSIIVVSFVFAVIIHLGIKAKDNYEIEKRKMAVNSEYNLCRNWKNQMDIIYKRCRYSNTDCSEQLKDLKEKFDDRKSMKMEMYEKWQDIGSLPELKKCTQDIDAILN